MRGSQSVVAEACREPAGLRCERRTASGPAGAAGDGIHTRNSRRENDPPHRPLRVRRRGQLGRRARIGRRGLAASSCAGSGTISSTTKGVTVTMRRLTLSPHCAIDEVWKRLLSPAAFAVTDGALVEGGRVVIRAATGDQLAGTVAWQEPRPRSLRHGRRLRQGHFPPQHLARQRPDRGSDLARQLRAERCDKRVRDFGVRTKALVERLFR